ncbi:MAG: VOC family protein [Ignavibacteriales bacterium]|nr:VOC family protein [Ignavibacteriales bacterium]
MIRALAFYRDLLGFQVTARFGKNAVFLSSGNYHHHIGLNTWAGENATPAPEGHTGLYHFAILYPSREDLAKAFKRVMGNQIILSKVHLIMVFLNRYIIKDPDGNGLELYCDKLS